MLEDRRYTDLRMNKLEEDLKELKVDQKIMASSVAEIREKIFNGFSHTINETHKSTDELKKSMTILTESVHDMKVHVYQTPEQRLAGCPLKKEMLHNYEKKLKLYLALGGLFITVLVGIPAWIALFLKVGG